MGKLLNGAFAWRSRSTTADIEDLRPSISRSGCDRAGEIEEANPEQITTIISVGLRVIEKLLTYVDQCVCQVVSMTGGRRHEDGRDRNS